MLLVKRECWNWQTGTFEVRVSTTYGFKSRLAHHVAVSPCGSPRFSFFDNPGYAARTTAPPRKKLRYASAVRL